MRPAKSQCKRRCTISGVTIYLAICKGSKLEPAIFARASAYSSLRFSYRCWACGDGYYAYSYSSKDLEAFEKRFAKLRNMVIQFSSNTGVPVVAPYIMEPFFFEIATISSETDGFEKCFAMGEKALRWPRAIPINSDPYATGSFVVGWRGEFSNLLVAPSLSIGKELHCRRVVGFVAEPA